MTRKKEGISKHFVIHAWCVLSVLFICRLIANYFIPLNDTTEARYGEIARKMLETGNWITLQHEYGVPFWAKPPLSTWFSAASMQLFGVNESAARLPALLFSIGVLWLIWKLAKRHSGPFVAMVSVLVLSGTLFFFLDAGTVMTEPALIFCTTLSFVAFWYALVDSSKVWSYLFFVGLGFGLLAKGPVALVLVGLPLFFWVLIHNKWMVLWKKLPWITGLLLMFLIALPWYILAELRTPGFLDYFIMGEHIHRFLTPGWSGDKYGIAHYAPKGMIWIYAIAGFFPWSIVGGIWLVRYRKKLFSVFSNEDGWISYLVLWVLAPLVFFTFASNIIYPYVFPSLPAYALLVTEIWHRANPSSHNALWITRFALICGVGALILTGVFEFKPELVAKTQKPVINAWIKQHPVNNNPLIYWSKTTEFSAQFYAQGKVKFTQNKTELCVLLSNHSANYLVINSNDTGEVAPDLLSKCTLIETIDVKTNIMHLFHCPVLSC